MVRRRDNRHHNHARVPQAKRNVERLPAPAFINLALFQRTSDDTGVVDHGAADAEGVPEMHGRHRSQGIDVIPRHEN